MFEIELGDSETGDCMRHECDLDLFPDGPEISFGEDEGTLSMSAEELLSKPAGNPNPKTLVGIYEATGTGSDAIGSLFLETACVTVRAGKLEIVTHKGDASKAASQGDKIAD